MAALGETLGGFLLAVGFATRAAVVASAASAITTR